jgi:hypothetical protein
MIRFHIGRDDEIGVGPTRHGTVTIEVYGEHALEVMPLEALALARALRESARTVLLGDVVRPVRCLR